jgi:hypothetical protein
MSRSSWRCLVGAGALLLALGRSAELPADTFIRGDSNLDRTIDITDAVSLLGCLYLGQACASCEDASDANDDGSLDLSDAVYTLAFAFLGGAAPRPPHPAPGPDPTADFLTCERGLGPEPVRIEVDPPTLELAPLEEVQLQVTAVFSDETRADRTAASSGTTYTVGDPTIATATVGGLVRGLAPGDTEVTVRWSGLSARVACSVQAPGGLPTIVISEIMYHPATENDRDEYLEIHNRGGRRIELNGYRFTEGVKFTFPEVGIDPGAYLVIARDAANVKARYGIANVIGDYELMLDDGGEMIRLKDPAGNTVNEVRYDDAGLWPRDADGFGSSLELIDLHGDNGTPGAWAASDEAARSAWTTFSCVQASTGSSDELHLLLLNQGECLIDNLQVLVGGVNRLTNGSFESGMQGWLAQGTHRLSQVTSESAVDGTRSLHLIATGRGDTAVNRVECDTSISVGAGQSVTIRGSVKWLSGSRFLLTRLWNNTVACSNALKAPALNGTPGAPNSTAVSNRGPDITQVAHFPLLPTSTQKVLVSALVTDVDGVSGVDLHYRPSGGVETRLRMADDGSGGDLAAGDGIYTAQIPARAAGSLVSFWITATDRSGAGTAFPTDAPAGRFPALFPGGDARTCLYRTGEPNPSSQFNRYHLFLPQSTVSLLRDGAKMSNELLDLTFVLNDTDVFYNAKLRYRGSPFIRSAPPTDPVNGRYAYRIDFGAHQPLGDSDEINLDNLEIGRDPTLQRERTAFILYQELGLPHSQNDYVRVWINGSDHQIYSDVHKVDESYVEAVWPDDADGYLHKIDDYFEFNDSGGFSNRNASLTNYGSKKEEYRWNWEKRTHNRDDEFSQLYQLAAKINGPDAGYEASVESVIDPEQWARTLAIRKIIGDWDSFGYNRGKNMYAYFPAIEKRWKLITWDMDFLLGNGDGPFTSLFGGIDAAVNRVLTYPKYRRMYLKAFRDLVDGPFRNEFLDPILNSTYTALAREASVSPPTSIKDYVRARRNYVLGQIPGPDLVITTNGGQDFSTSATSVVIAGQAPLEVETFRLNGAALTPTRVGIAGWSFTRSIPLGETVFLVDGLEGTGAVVSSDSIRVLRVPPCMPASLEPAQAPAGPSVAITVHGSGFVPGSSPKIRLTSASGETGFNALYVQAPGSFGGGAEAMDNAVALLNNPASAQRSLATTHRVINLRSGGGGEIFPNPAKFPAPWNGDPANFAARYTGFINVPSPGTRTFGVHSDDGFRLTIAGSRVAEWPQPRAPATSIGDFNFPAAGSYPLVLEWYENAGGDLVELFQSDPSGGQALLNSGSELGVTVDDSQSIHASSTVVEDAATIRSTFDLSGAAPGVWNLVITPEEGSDCTLKAALTVE